MSNMFKNILSKKALNEKNKQNNQVLSIKLFNFK